MYVANISKFSDTYTVNRKKVVTTSASPILILPSSSQPIIASYPLSPPVLLIIAYHRLSPPSIKKSSLHPSCKLRHHHGTQPCRLRAQTAVPQRDTLKAMRHGKADLVDREVPLRPYQYGKILCRRGGIRICLPPVL